MGRFSPRLLSSHKQLLLRGNCAPPLCDSICLQQQPVSNPDCFASFRAASFAYVCSFYRGNETMPAGCLWTSLLPSRKGIFEPGSVGQHRRIPVQTQSTPNPISLMFFPGKPVMDVGSADFPNARTAMTSPLAKSLF